MTDRDITFSIIVPTFNSSGHIAAFFSYAQSRLAVGESYEILFVNDGSTDATEKELHRIKQGNPQVTIINLPSNRGQHYAVSRGIQAAEGKYILVVDDDQPFVFNHIGTLGERLERYDLIVFWRKWRRVRGFRAAASWIMNAAVSIRIRRRVHDFGGPKVFANKAIDGLKREGSMLKILTHCRQLNLCEIELPCGAPLMTGSRYTVKKLRRLFCQIISSLR